jgi:hypothetical protein
MNRTQTALAAFLALQFLLILIVRSPFSSATAPVEAQPLLVTLQETASAPARVELSGREDKSLTLVREGDAWTIEEFGGFPADSGKIDDLLDDLRELTVRRPVVSSGRHHGSFKVGAEDNEGRVRIFGAEGDEPLVDLILGTSPNYRLLHVRRSGEDEVYETRGLSSYDVRPESASWIVKSLVDVDETEIVQVTIANPNGTIELARGGGVWNVVSPSLEGGGEIDVSAIESLVRSMTSLQFADGVGAVDETAHGLGEGATVVTLVVERGPGLDGETVESEEIVLRIGAKLAAEDTKRYVTRDGFAFTGTIWDSSVSQLVEKKADELLVSSDVEG